MKLYENLSGLTYILQYKNKLGEFVQAILFKNSVCISIFKHKSWIVEFVNLKIVGELTIENIDFHLQQKRWRLKND